MRPFVTMLKAGVLTGLAAAGAAGAEPLVFGALDGTRDLSGAPALAGCARAARAGEAVCRLARDEFGGLTMLGSRALLNGAGRLRALDILLDREALGTARALLAGRYGPPGPSADGAPVWRFDAGARLTLRQTVAGTLIAFDFPANAAAPAPPPPPATAAAAGSAGLDGAAETLPLLLVAAVALALAGRAWWRRRRPPPRPVAAQPTMRETLERRLRDGTLEV